jgi:hypothetical protein
VIVRLLFAALLGGVIGAAELVARYRDKPSSAVFSPSGLLYVFVNASASMLALVAVEATGWRFGLPLGVPPVSEYVVRVMAAGLGAAALFRTSFTLAQDKGISFGPISILHGMLKIVDAALERKRALSRLSHNDLAGLSFVRAHAALAELCCHALQRFDLAEAQRLGELAADLRAREDLTDADKLDCFGLELSRLVGERALRKAADRLRDRADGSDEGQAAAVHWQQAAPAPRHHPRPEPVEEGTVAQTVPQMVPVARVPSVQDAMEDAQPWRDDSPAPVAAPVAVAVGGGQEAHSGSLRSAEGQDQATAGAGHGGHFEGESDRTLRFKAPPGARSGIPDRAATPLRLCPLYRAVPGRGRPRDRTTAVAGPSRTRPERALGLKGNRPSGLGEDERQVTEADLIAGADLGRSREPPAVDPCAVHRAEVGHRPLAVDLAQLGVET